MLVDHVLSRHTLSTAPYPGIAGAFPAQRLVEGNKQKGARRRDALVESSMTRARVVTELVCGVALVRADPLIC